RPSLGGEATRPAIGASLHRDVSATVDCQRQDLPAGVVGVLADQVDAARSGADHVRLTPVGFAKEFPRSCCVQRFHGYLTMPELYRQSPEMVFLIDARRYEGQH